MKSTDHVVVFDVDADRAGLIASIIKKDQPWTAGRDVMTLLNGEGFAAIGLSGIKGGRTALAVIVENAEAKTAFPGLAEFVRLPGVASLLVLESVGDPSQLPERVRGFDGWLTLDSLERELSGRITEVLDRFSQRLIYDQPLPSIDPRFLAVVIHDLRTPLNVIGLTIRTIEQTTPNRDSELDEDLTMLKENSWQIERMLAQLGDHCRLIEADSPLSVVEFDPRRFLTDHMEAARTRPGIESTPIRLEIADSCPSEVALDPKRVVMALDNALGNAINAARRTPVRVRASGGPDRWTIELIVDRPPPQVVQSIPLRPEVFERLLGSESERRGLDLAIAARVSQLFGGSARLVVEPGRRSTVILDWPQRLSAEDAPR